MIRRFLLRLASPDGAYVANLERALRDCERDLTEIYKWTAYKHTTWACRAARSLDVARAVLRARAALEAKP